MSTDFWRDKSVLVTGGSGFLGSRLVGMLEARRPTRIFVPRSVDHDLRRREHCRAAVAEMDIVIHLAAQVGGIGLNREAPGELFYSNLMMGAHLMEEKKRFFENYARDIYLIVYRFPITRFINLN